MIHIKQIQSKSEWSEFIDLPWKIYHGDPYWVPPLRIAVRDLLDTTKNPFFKHAEMFPLLAYRGKECVGRIVGVIDQNHNEFHQEHTVFFGFFESTDDSQVVDALMNAVVAWGREKGMKVLRGPMNPSTNHECGLLVEGFEDSPTVMMTYNPPYYAKLLEGWGLTKAKDLYAYFLDANKSEFSSRLLKRAEKIHKSSSIKFREVNMADFDREVDRILEVYNDAWEKNWGFVPQNPEEFRHMAKDMKLIVDPRLCLIAELKGEVIGFSLALPDVNQVFKKVPNGKLLPSGLFKLLWHLKGPGRKKTINRCRVITLGIKRAYREMGLGPLFYTEYLRRAAEFGYQAGEASWILEDNRPMNRALELMSGQRSKVYRIYDRPLT